VRQTRSLQGVRVLVRKIIRESIAAGASAGALISLSLFPFFFEKKRIIS